jgi:hypothetical protein
MTVCEQTTQTDDDRLPCRIRPLAQDTHLYPDLSGLVLHAVIQVCWPPSRAKCAGDAGEGQKEKK